MTAAIVARCPECRVACRVPPGRAARCPKCGARIAPTTRRTVAPAVLVPPALWIVLAIVLGLAAFAPVASTGSGVVMAWDLFKSDGPTALFGIFLLFATGSGVAILAARKALPVLAVLGFVGVVLLFVIHGRSVAPLLRCFLLLGLGVMVAASLLRAAHPGNRTVGQVQAAAGAAAAILGVIWGILYVGEYRKAGERRTKSEETARQVGSSQDDSIRRLQAQWAETERRQDESFRRQEESMRKSRMPEEQIRRAREQHEAMMSRTRESRKKPLEGMKRPVTPSNAPEQAEAKDRGRTVAFAGSLLALVGILAAIAIALAAKLPKPAVRVALGALALGVVAELIALLGMSAGGVPVLRHLVHSGALFGMIALLVLPAAELAHRRIQSASSR